MCCMQIAAYHTEISNSIQMGCGKHFTVASFENDTNQMTWMMSGKMFFMISLIINKVSTRITVLL